MQKKNIDSKCIKVQSVRAINFRAN